MRSYDSKEARADLESAIRLDRGRLYAYFLRGILYLREHAPHKALSDFDKAIELSAKENPELYVKRAHALGEMGQPEEALAEYKRALQMQPDLAEAYYGLGNLFKELGRSEEALEAYNETIRLAPEQEAPFLNRGVILHSRGEFEKAIADYTRVIQSDHPRVEAAYNNRGAAYFETGRYREAKTDLDEAIRRNPNYREALFTRGQTGKALGNYKEAIADFEKVLNLSDDDADVHNSLAWILAVNQDGTLRDGKKALQHALKACDLKQWSDCATLDTLAASFAEAGDFRNAVRYEEQAIALAPSDAGKREELQGRLQLYHLNTPYRATNP